MGDTEKLDIIFDNLFKVFSSDRFLRGQGTAGEIQSYAQTYDPKDQLAVEDRIPHLIKRLSNAGIEVLEANLYHVCMELLKKQGVLDGALEVEKGMSKAEYLEALGSQLKGEEPFADYIQENVRHGAYRIVFMTGVGAVYPVVLVRSILPKLEGTFKDIPLVTFFPGTYDNFRFKLYGLIPMKGFYRAFNLSDYKV